MNALTETLRGPRRSGPDARTSSVFAIGCGSAAVLGWLSVRAPGLTVLVAGAVLTTVLALLRPAWLLSLGVYVTLVSPAAFGFARYGSRILLIGGIVCVLAMATTRFSDFPRRCIWMLALLGILCVSVGLGSGLQVASSFFVCLAAVVICSYMLSRGDSWQTPMAVGGGAFVALSLFAGDLTASGQRFEGVSGNPNRMVLGVLVSMCFLLQSLQSRHRFSERCGTLICLAIGVSLVLESGSAQGIVGLLVLALIVLLRISGGASGARSVALAATLGFAAIAWLTWFAPILSEDTLTLSGRTGIFEAGLQTFLANPFLGTGELHVSYGTGVDRSTHNSILGIAVASGVVGLSLWLVILWKSTTASLGCIRQGHLVGAAGIMVLVTQSVQQVESVPIVWAVLAVGGYNMGTES